MKIRTPSPSRAERGFTLVELMVAITGGLFVTIAVFVLAKHGSSFYQRESRVANATLGGILGFERLRADIERASFLSTPNVRRDPNHCGTVDGTWPGELGRLAGIRIVPGGSPANNTLANNGLAPDALYVAGSFATVEQFPIQRIEALPSAAGYRVYLNNKGGAYSRSTVGDASAVGSIFTPGRAVRIVDRTGRDQYGVITGVDVATNPDAPYVQLAAEPALVFRQDTGTTCGIKGFCTDCLLSVIGLVKYDVRSLSTNSSYAPLYSDAGTGPGDDDRTELVREELDLRTDTETPLASTEELVAEYAVNLQFGLTVATNIVGGTDPSLARLGFGDADIANWAGDVSTLAVGAGPELIRSVRARLTVRSREADRGSDIAGNDAGPIAPGLYRVAIGDGGSFARTRTVQAEIALHNQAGVLW